MQKKGVSPTKKKAFKKKVIFYVYVPDSLTVFGSSSELYHVNVYIITMFINTRCKVIFSYYIEIDQV